MEKRVLIVGMSPEPGGIETFLLAVFQRFDKKLMRFDVLTACPRCAYEAELKKMGVRVFHTARRGKRPIQSFLDKRRFFMKRGYLYDVVWLHLSSASDLSAISLAKRYTNARIVCHSHSVSFESKGGLVRAAHQVLHRMNQKKLTELCDVCIAVTNEAGQWLYGNIGNRLVVLPNGVDTEMFRYDDGVRRATRQSLGLQDNIAVGHVGRLVPVKNQRFLIDAFAAFHAAHKNAVLLIAGAGELEEELRAYAKKAGIGESVRFLGFRSDVSTLLQAFDVFLLPSLFEGFPVVLVEAQAAALPCVVSDTVTKEVAATQFVRFCSIQESPTTWAAQIESALKLRRDATGAKAALERAGLTQSAAQDKLFSILYGE